MRFVKYSLLVLLVFSPLAFGSVEAWAYSIINLVALLLFVIWAGARLFFQSPDDEIAAGLIAKPHLFYFPLAFLAWVIFQLAPLPVSLVRILSPHRIAYLENLKAADFGWKLPGSISLSVNPYLTSLALLNMACLLILFFLMVQMLKDDSLGIMERDLGETEDDESGASMFHSFYKLLSFTIMALGFGIALFGILQKLSGTHEIYWTRQLRFSFTLMGPFVNRDHFGGFLEMCMGVTLGPLLFLRGKVPYRNLLGFAAIVMGTAIMYSGSRGGMVGFIFELICAGMLIWALRSERFGRKIPEGSHRDLRGSQLLFIPILLVAVILGIFYVGPGSVLGRVQEKIATDERIPVWHDTIRIVKSFPLVGSGFGTFRSVFPHFRTQDYVNTYLQAHNDYLQLLSETGVIGVALILLAILAVVLPVFLNRGSPSDTPHHVGRADQAFRSAVQYGALLGVMALLLHSFFDFNLQIPSNAFMFLTLCALVATAR